MSEQSGGVSSLPYFISDSNPACNGWAVEKADGEVIGCHTTKQSAIDQMVAVSIAENIPPGGERDLPDAYRPALSEDVPEGRACGNCLFYDESRKNPAGDMAWCERWDEFVRGDFYCDAWRPDGSRDAPAPKSDQIEGSEENEPGSAQGAGGDITLSKATETALRNKVKEHNDQMEEEDKPDYTRTTYGQLAAVYRRGAGAYSTSHRPGVSRAAWAMARVNSYLYLLRNGEPENPAYITDNDLLPEGHPKSTRSLENRQVNLEPPAYMRASARRGLEWYSEGLGGDGLVDRTIREARLMADGQVSADKWVRIAAWIARHIGDLDAPDADPQSENFPSPGVVAMALWGGGTTRRSAQRAQTYAEGVVTRLEAEQERANMKQETRNFDADFELRAEGDGMTFVGYAAKFNSPSEDLGGFVETIEQGAFRKSLRSRNDVKLLVNHDTGRVLASTRAGTMKLYEDEVGLRVEASLPNTTDGRDMAELLKRGDLNKMSFGFSVIKDSWNNEMTQRTLKSVRLFETSIVAFPAYAATEAMVRSLDKVAQRAQVDADELADAVIKLEEGADLTDQEAELITKVVHSLAPQKQVEEEEEINLLELKRKQLDLLLKKP
jgi:HK97 family phage prohead protease